jgi:hypothetical protein
VWVLARPSMYKYHIPIMWEIIKVIILVRSTQFRGKTSGGLNVFFLSNRKPLSNVVAAVVWWCDKIGPPHFLPCWGCFWTREGRWRPLGCSLVKVVSATLVFAPSLHCFIWFQYGSIIRFWWHFFVISSSLSSAPWIIWPYMVVIASYLLVNLSSCWGPSSIIKFLHPGWFS